MPANQAPTWLAFRGRSSGELSEFWFVRSTRDTAVTMRQGIADLVVPQLDLGQ